MDALSRLHLDSGATALRFSYRVRPQPGMACGARASYTLRTRDDESAAQQVGAAVERLAITWGGMLCDVRVRPARGVA